MSWRKWLVRGLVFSVLGSLLLVGLLYQAWTNPAAVRRLVLDKLGVRFLHVTVGLESAHLRLLGGIAIHDLRMARSDGLDHSDFLYVPSAVLYHDKEHMLDGKVALRKVELTRPQLRLVRQRDGGFNLRDILGPADLDERMPTVVIRHGTILLEDHARTRPGPLLEIKDVHLTILNDPLPTLQVEGTGNCDLLGPVKIRATSSRLGLTARLHVELQGVPLGPALVQRLAESCPGAALAAAADHLRQGHGVAAVVADLAYTPQAQKPLTWDVNVRLSNGELTHARLAAPLRQIEGEARIVNCSVPHARLRATLGGARVEATLEDLDPTAVSPTDPDHPLGALDHAVRELDLRFEHLSVTGDVLQRLPRALSFIKKDYQPGGPVTLTYSVRRAPGGAPRTHWLASAEGMTGNCCYFRYPVEDIRGTLDMDTSVPGQCNVTLDLTGRAGDCPVTLRGKVVGRKPTCGIDLEVRGRGLRLDDRVLQALRHLPGKSYDLALQFLPDRSRELGLHAYPLGRADVVAHIRRERGQREVKDQIEIAFREGSLRYALFPYPLENVSGVLTLYPDRHWECRNCRGTHAGGEILVDGRSYRLPPRAPQAVVQASAPARPSTDPEEGAVGGPADRGERVHMVIRGRNILLDSEFAQALSPPGVPDRQALFNTWRMLALAGRMNFTAEVVDNPGQPQDLDVGVEIQGCTMKPTFFPYALDSVSGSVRYAKGRVSVGEVQARHGRSTLGLRSGLVQLKPGGGFLAWLRGIQGRQLTPDEDFLTALPEPLRKGVEPLKLRDPLDVETSLTLDASPGVSAPLKVWWDGGATLRDASLTAGVALSKVSGQVSCHGHHDGKQMRGVDGHVLFERAAVLGQPLSNVHARLEVDPSAPNTVRLRDLRADVFGGTLGGEARVETGPAFRYDVLLEGVGLRLEQFGKHNLGASAGAQLTGSARAALHLMGEGTDLLGLKGNGRVDVDSGRMGQLPILLDLVKAVGLRVPDRTAFEQAHLTFAIEGPQVRVQQLDLFGNAVSLRGAGGVDIDGRNVNLDFSATPGRVSQVLPPGIDLIPQAISEQLLKIKMRGRLDKPDGLRFEKVLVPRIVEPLERAIGAS